MEIPVHGHGCFACPLANRNGLGPRPSAALQLLMSDLCDMCIIFTLLRHTVECTFFFYKNLFSKNITQAESQLRTFLLRPNVFKMSSINSDKKG